MYNYTKISIEKVQLLFSGFGHLFWKILPLCAAISSRYSHKENFNISTKMIYLQKYKRNATNMAVKYCSEFHRKLQKV